jgi:hypothetical protein
MSLKVCVFFILFSTCLFGNDTNSTLEDNYLTQVTFRQNIYRKWLFYEVSPGVNFSKENDFDPNYRFFVKLDFFLEKCRNA